MCQHMSTELILTPLILKSDNNSLTHSYIQLLKYYLVPREEKCYAHLREVML